MRVGGCRSGRDSLLSPPLAAGIGSARARAHARGEHADRLRNRRWIGVEIPRTSHSVSRANKTNARVVANFCVFLR